MDTEFFDIQEDGPLSKLLGREPEIGKVPNGAIDFKTIHKIGLTVDVKN